MISYAIAALGLYQACLTGYDLGLATALLAAAPGAPVPEVAAEEWIGLRAAIVTVATRFELYDARGEPDPHADCDLFDRRERFAENLDLVRERRAELADAPPIGDAFRLPPSSALARGREEYWSLRKRAEVLVAAQPERAAEARRVLREADRYLDVWTAALEARDPQAAVGDRRRALMHLRRLIGDGAYRRVELPPLPRLDRRPE